MTNETRCADRTAYQSLSLNLGFILHRFYSKTPTLIIKNFTHKVTNVVALSCLALIKTFFFFFSLLVDRRTRFCYKLRVDNRLTEYKPAEIFLIPA